MTLYDCQCKRRKKDEDVVVTFLEEDDGDPLRYSDNDSSDCSDFPDEEDAKSILTVITLVLYQDISRTVSIKTIQ